MSCEGCEEGAYVIDALAKLLAEIAIIVNGLPPSNISWSYHDLPEKVRALKQAQQPAALAVPAEGLTVKEAWWAGARAALGLESDTPRDQVASAFLTAAEPQAQQPAAAVPEGYAGCTLWRDGLRVTVIDGEVIEQRADADEAFCELAQRALDSFAAAWDARHDAMLAAANKENGNG